MIISHLNPLAMTTAGTFRWQWKVLEPRGRRARAAAAGYEQGSSKGFLRSKLKKAHEYSRKEEAVRVRNCREGKSDYELVVASGLLLAKRRKNRRVHRSAPFEFGRGQIVCFVPPQFTRRPALWRAQVLEFRGRDREYVVVDRSPVLKSKRLLCNVEVLHRSEVLARITN